MNREKHLETIVSIVFGLAIIYWLTGNQYVLYAIIIIAAIGLFSRFLSEKIHWFWHGLAHVMGTVMSKVILSAVFFLFLVPIALLSRLFKKKDLLQLKKSNETYYSLRNHEYVAEDLENPW